MLFKFFLFRKIIQSKLDRLVAQKGDVVGLLEVSPYALIGVSSCRSIRQICVCKYWSSKFVSIDYYNFKITQPCKLNFFSRLQKTFKC